MALDLEWRNYCACAYDIIFKVVLRNWNIRVTALAFPITKRQNTSDLGAFMKLFHFDIGSLFGLSKKYGRCCS